MTILDVMKKIPEDNRKKIVFGALVGSHNYNLNDEHSDKDYKLFVMPSFEDVYKGKEVAKNVVSEDVDYTVHDIRKLGYLLYKTNINFMEPLFAAPEEMYIVDNDIGESFRQLFIHRREEIARINLPYLFDACRGMSHEKMKRLHKYSESNAWMEKDFGYNTKEACHAYRVLDTCIRYVKYILSGTKTPFENAMKFIDQDREWYMNLKAGKMTEDKFMYSLGFVTGRFENFIMLIKDNDTIIPNEKLYNEIQTWCYNQIKLSCYRELRGEYQ